MAQRYCTNCGNGLREGDVFCASCGKPAHETAAVATPEADVDVPPPPTTSPQAGGGAQEGSSGKSGVWRARNVIIALLITIVVLTIVTSPDGGGGGEADGGGGGQASDQGAQAGGGSGETFTQENYPELVSDPGAHEGAEVDITGQIFTAPELVEGDTAFQMFADPENGEWNTAVLTEGSGTDLGTDDYVRVVGTVAGEMEGENAMGGTVTAVMVEADEVDVVSGVEAVDPAEETVEVGRTLTDQGFSVELKKVEFGEDTTRVYVAAYNGTGTGASFYDFDAKILQGSQQFDQETTFDYEVEAPQSDLNAGVRTDGVITFGKADPSQPMEVRFEWSSDNYDVTTRPLVFRVEP